MKKDLKEFKTFPSSTIKEIQRAAKEGIYQIRGLGAKRKVPDFDDLVFLGASMSRYPLEGYREKCNTSVILGDRFAKNPIKLDIPITIAGMSFGALGANACTLFFALKKSRHLHPFVLNHRPYFCPASLLSNKWMTLKVVIFAFKDSGKFEKNYSVHNKTIPYFYTLKA